MCRLAGRTDLAEDITLECFRQLVRHPERWHPERGNLRTYLFAIARNLAFKQLRDQHASLDLNEDEAVGVADQRVAYDLALTVAQLVAQLPDLQREALILFE